MKAMQSKTFFVTGTDTGVGKTLVSCALLQAFQKQGYTTAALKPIASGGIETAKGLCNEDVLMLSENATLKLPYEIINPYLFSEPIAPYIAAQHSQRTMTLKELHKACEAGLHCGADRILMEGVGGWLQPINAKETVADFIAELKLPVVMVVGMRLGCINHTLLTFQNIKSYGVPFLGWVANCIDPEMLVLKENIETLTEYLQMPPLAILPYQSEVNIKTLSDYFLNFVDEL
ncbi:MAG: dethiobiotin synthase [Proteobacteria bacterium]|nr:dethiobiotin synthase [Pseudomonadota bacterium]